MKQTGDIQEYDFEVINPSCGVSRVAISSIDGAVQKGFFVLRIDREDQPFGWTGKYLNEKWEVGLIGSLFSEQVEIAQKVKEYISYLLEVQRNLPEEEREKPEVLKERELFSRVKSEEDSELSRERSRSFWNFSHRKANNNSAGTPVEKPVFSPVAEKETRDVLLEQKPLPVEHEEPVEQPKTKAETKTKGMSMASKVKVPSEIQKIFEVAYEVRKTDENAVLNGTTRDDARSRQIIALIMNETVEGKSPSQLAEYLKLEVKPFYKLVHHAKKYREERPDFKADYRAVMKELGTVDSAGASSPESSTSTVRKKRVQKTKALPTNGTLLDDDDLVLILWKTGKGTEDIARILDVDPSEIKQSIGEIVLSSSGGEDPIKSRIRTIGDKLLKFAES